MPDSFEIVFWLIIVAVFWLRGLSAAAKKARAREQQALEGTEREPGLTDEKSEFRGRRSLLGGWADMAKRIEQQMQDAAAEGRPGSFVAHVDDDEEDAETIVIPGRRILPSPREASLPARRAEARPVVAEQRELARRSHEVTRARPTYERPSYQRPSSAPKPPPRRTEPIRQQEAAMGPLERLDRYPPIQRAIILSEILGTPPGLKKSPREGR